MIGAKSDMQIPLPTGAQGSVTFQTVNDYGALTSKRQRPVSVKRRREATREHDEEDNTVLQGDFGYVSPLSGVALFAGECCVPDEPRRKLFQILRVLSADTASVADLSVLKKGNTTARYLPGGMTSGRNDELQRRRIFRFARAVHRR